MAIITFWVAFEYIEKYTFIWNYSAFKINVSECKINNVNNAFLKSMLTIQIFAEAYKFFKKGLALSLAGL